MRSGASAGRSVRLAAASSDANTMSDQSSTLPSARSKMKQASAVPP